MGSRFRIVAWGGAALLLLLPLIAMQFTPEVVWTIGDFLVFGGMLLVALAAGELVVRLSAKTATRAVAGIAIAVTFFLVWLELAVGIAGPG